VAFRFTGKEILKWAGVNRTALKATPYGDLDSFHRALSQDERGQLQGHCDEIYRLFKEHVARGRDMDMDAVEKIAQGQVRCLSGSGWKEAGKGGTMALLR
jgi:ClpP class serine protease